MKKLSAGRKGASVFILVSLLFACNHKNQVSESDIEAMNLKKGSIIFCGPQGAYIYTPGALG